MIREILKTHFKNIMLTSVPIHSFRLINYSTQSYVFKCHTIYKYSGLIPTLNLSVNKRSNCPLTLDTLQSVKFKSLRPFYRCLFL